MKKMNVFTILVSTAILLAPCAGVQAQENMVVKETSIGTLKFQRSFPTEEKERTSVTACDTNVYMGTPHCINGGICVHVSRKFRLRDGRFLPSK